MEIIGRDREAGWAFTPHLQEISVRNPEAWL